MEVTTNKCKPNETNFVATHQGESITITYNFINTDRLSVVEIEHSQVETYTYITIL